MTATTNTKNCAIIIVILIISILFLTSCIHSINNSEGKLTSNLNNGHSDIDNDGLSDIHDISPSDIDAPTNRDQFQDYFSRNQAIEYSIGKWLKNDELSIVESLANKIDVPILKDIIKKAIYDALIDRINWQVMRVTLMPNKRDDNLHVQFYLIMTLPNWSFDIPPKVTVDCKASFVYNLTYNDSTIIDDELDGNAWNFERIEDYN